MDTTDASEFYVKFPDKTSGPFSLAQLQKLVDRGRLDRDRLVSSDRAKWFPAGTIDELSFDSLKREPKVDSIGEKWPADFVDPNAGEELLLQGDPTSLNTSFGPASIVLISSEADFEANMSSEALSQLVEQITTVVKRLCSDQRFPAELLIRVDLLSRTRQSGSSHLVKIAVRGRVDEEVLSGLHAELDTLDVDRPEHKSLTFQIQYRLEGIGTRVWIMRRFWRGAITFSVVASLIPALLLVNLFTNDGVVGNVLPATAFILVLAVCAGFAGALTHRAR